MKNPTTTREASSAQEEYIAKKFHGSRTPNSGAGRFKKGDVILNCGLLVECKTCMTNKSSFSIKKEWLTKNAEEAFTNRNSTSCLVFNFGPGEKNYFIVDEFLMSYLVEKLEQENNLI